MESPPRVRDDPGMFKDENGQAIAEAALVLPAVLVLLLLTVQLTLLQRARILVEAAAFSAARAGIVLKGDPARMQEAAAVALLPGFGRTDSLAAVARTLARFKAESERLEPLGLSACGCCGCTCTVPRPATSPPGDGTSTARRSTSTMSAPAPRRRRSSLSSSAISASCACRSRTA